MHIHDDVRLVLGVDLVQERAHAIEDAIVRQRRHARADHGDQRATARVASGRIDKVGGGQTREVHGARLLDAGAVGAACGGWHE